MLGLCERILQCQLFAVAEQLADEAVLERRDEEVDVGGEGGGGADCGCVCVGGVGGEVVGDEGVEGRGGGGGLGVEGREVGVEGWVLGYYCFD